MQDDQDSLPEDELAACGRRIDALTARCRNYERGRNLMTGEHAEYRAGCVMLEVEKLRRDFIKAQRISLKRHDILDAKLSLLIKYLARFPESK